MPVRVAEVRKTEPSVVMAQSKSEAKRPGRLARIGEWHQDQGGCRGEPIGVAAGGDGAARMISPPAGVRIWVAAGATATRSGFEGLASLVAQ